MPDFPSQPLSPDAKETLARATDESAATEGGATGSDSGPSRKYRLKRKESGSSGITRIAAGRLDEALDHLRDGLDHDLATAVHESRKDLKKTRAVLRLVRAKLGDDRYRAENERLRDAGRLLSAARDAEVRLGTVRSLRDHFPDEMPPQAFESLIGALEADRRRLSDDGDGRAETWRSADQAVAMIEASRAAVEDWGLRGPAWKLIKDGLARSYRRGRRGFRATVSEPGVETVHEWRKRVKDFWYHLRLIHGCWPTVIGGLADEAHELSDLLGDHHDLAVLAEELRDRRDAVIREDELETIMELIERRQDELLEAAVPIGERLYVEKPKQFARRIHGYWEAWRSD
jgi:CHAD domain-containing protein